MTIAATGIAPLFRLLYVRQHQRLLSRAAFTLINTPTDPAFGPDGDLCVRAHSGGRAVPRFDGSKAGFIDVFVHAGSTGFNIATTGMFFVDPCGS